MPAGGLQRQPRPPARTRPRGAQSLVGCARKADVAEVQHGRHRAQHRFPLRLQRTLSSL